MSPPPLPDRFRIFFVCTGNQARSPIAAAWTARRLADLPVDVGSAGTLPRRSSPVLEEASEIAGELGIDLTGHRSNHVTSFDLSIDDLVIGFELHHVAAAVVDAGADAEKAFLLREFVRLAAAVPPPPVTDPVARARAIVAGAADVRAKTGYVVGEEVRDPAGRRPRVFREIVAEVVAGCDEMAGLLFGR